MLRRFHWLPLLLVVVGLGAAIAVLAGRHLLERGNRAVELVLDYNQLRALTSATGVPVEQAFRRFHAAGILGIAVTEETLADLQTKGVLEVRERRRPSGAREYRVTTTDAEVADRLADYLPLVVRATEVEPPGDLVVFAGLGGGSLYVAGRFEDLRTTPTGLDAGVVREVQTAGFRPVGRINNAVGLRPDSIRRVLQRVKDLGVGTVIFGGEEVLGYRGLVGETAAAFRDLGLMYGSVEFGKQRGDDELARKLEDQLVRVHSISAAEMPRLSPEEAIERYVRAAVERNIRLDYVRLPISAGPNSFEDSVAFVARLSRRIAAADFGLGGAVGFGRPRDPVLDRIGRAGIGLGIGAGALLLLAGLVPISRRAQAALGGAAAAACALVALSGISLGLQALALLAAVTFPALAFVLLPQPIGAYEDHKHAAVRTRAESLVPALAEFGAISAVTLVGALMLAGLLSQLPFMVKMKSFAGIKIATVLPILIVAWTYLTGMSGGYPSADAERDAVQHRLRRFFSEPIHVWHVAAFMVGVGALLLLIDRSGNDSGLGVSALELRFRAVLDQTLGIRPRTKEFLIGHPALILSLAMAALPHWRRWAFPLLLVGIIGQVGMLNSFCHLHTPIKVTLIRTFNGLWIGSLLGALAVGLWLLAQGQNRPRTERGRV